MNPLLVDVVYAGAMLAGSPWLLYRMATTGKYRSGLRERLGFIEGRDGGDCFWVHGVSVGEILAAKGIVSALESSYPGVETVLSTTTDTGQEVARANYPGNFTFYFPLDFSWAVRRTLRRVRPRIIVLMEMEVWPNFLTIARREDVPVVVANGRITERAFNNYRRFGSLARSMLGQVDMYLVQNDTYAERLRRLGVPGDRVRVTGSVKFDALSTGADPALRERLREQMALADEQILIIGGSTHEGEEKALLDAYREISRRNRRARLLIVPRHRTRFEAVAALIRAEGFDVFRRSSLAGGARPAGGEVLLGDTMGELADLYHAADVAFVGGSLIPHGGQNILEPAARGVPVVFGPSMENFPEGRDMLVSAGAATCVSRPGELAGALEAYMDPDAARTARRAAFDALEKAGGASAATVETIGEILKAGKKVNNVSWKGAGSGD